MFNLGVNMARMKRILVLAMPVVIAMLTQTSINVVDTIFVGKLSPDLSIPGQAALGFSLPLLWAFGGSLSALGIGAQVMTARRYGAGDVEESGQILTNGIVVATLSSILVSILAWFLIPTLFSFLTQNDAVIELGVPYARFRIIGVISMVLTTIYKGFFDGLGKTKIHMYAAIVMNGVNILLNYSLIFGFGPIPAMYVTGAAIASLISTFIGLFILMGWTFLPSVRKFKVYRPKNLNISTMWNLVKLSAPSGLAQVFIMGGVLMFLKIIASLDTTHIQDMLEQLHHASPALITSSNMFQHTVQSSSSVGQTLFLQDWSTTLMHTRPPVFTTAAKLIIDLLSIGFVTCIAFGTATATLVSQAMGKKNYQEASDFGWDSVKMSMYFYGALGLVIIVMPELFLDLLSDDHMVIKAAAPGLQIMAGLEMLIAMALVLTQALFGAGATRYVMVVEFLLHGLCLAPMAYLFAFVLDLGFLGVWLSGTLYVFLLALAMSVKFWRGSWTKIQV